MRRALVRGWLLWLQVVVPGFVLHEAAHYLAGRWWATDARLVLTPAGRLQCATAWDRGAQWRRVAVAFAPAAVGAVWGLAVAVAGAAVAPTGTARLGLALWAGTNLAVLAIPSPADIRLARGADLNGRPAERSV